MCGRFTVASPAEVLAHEFGLDEVDAAFAPRFNLAPTQDAPVVTGGSLRRLELFRWGLIPSWTRGAGPAKPLINARSESAATSRTFGDAFTRRRCLVLADGFYEWQRVGSRRIPLLFRLRSRRPFAFAGLWEGWIADDGEIVRSCAVLTAAPNALVAPIHDRMPVILAPDAREPWLTAEQPELAQALCEPYPASEMECFTVTARVGSPTFDEPACLVREAPGGTLPLFPGRE